MSISEAMLSSQQSDNTTAYSTVSGLTLTPAAGTYLVMLTISVSSGAANYTTVAIGVDGTEETASARQHYHEGSIWGQTRPCPQATHAIVTVNGSEAIQARWRSSTSVLRYASTGGLSIISIASGDATEVASETDITNIGGTPVKVTDFGTPAADEYLVVWSTSVRAGAVGDTVHAALYVDDAEIPHTERRYFCETSLTTVTSWGISFAAVVTLNGSEEMSVRMWRTGSGDASCFDRNGVRIKGRTLLQVTGTAADTESTSGTDKAIDDLTHVNPAAEDYLAIGTGVFQYGSISADATTTFKLFEETTEVTNSNRAYTTGDSLDNMDYVLPIAQKVSPNGSEDVSLQWRGDTTDTRTAEERTFVLISDAAVGLVREQEGFRWRDDDADEDEAAWLELQDVNTTRAREENTRVRILTDTAAGDPPSEGLELEYRKVGDPDSEWRKVPLT